MTIKEAILKSLEDISRLTSYLDIYNNILKHGYYNFGPAKTPAATVSALLGDFIRNGDSRVKRIKQENGSFLYYLTKNEHTINTTEPISSLVDSERETITKKKKDSYEERDLHKLLASYLKSTNTFSKTIYHEQSNGKDSNQIWTHPDMVGIKFLTLQTKASQNLLKSINRLDTFKMSSYELKKEINNDGDLKRAFFQAVSNSSWANFGYLVAFDISTNLQDEMARLSQSFGIGIIELNANPYQSKILFPATYRELDFKTIDKLCAMNSAFSNFIEHAEKLLTASEKFLSGAEKELDEFCDDYFKSDSEVEEYCRSRNIPNE